MKSEDMKDEWEEADAKQQQQVEEHGESSFPHTAWFREVVKFQQTRLRSFSIEWLSGL
jgi:hypothetical protein